MSDRLSETDLLKDTAVVLFSHGSLLCGAGVAVGDHARRIRDTGLFGDAGVGFLNYSEPSFDTTVAEFAAAGFSRIVVAPYFLVPGYFVSVALPKKLASARQAYPGIDFVVAGSLGADSRLADALIATAECPRPRDRWREALFVDPEHCRMRDDCIVYGTSYCPVHAQTTLAWQAPMSDVRALQASADLPALLVLVHGSPKAEANETMYAVIEQVRSRRVFSYVQAGFMECNKPTISEAIDQCIEAGATRVVAAPYFLHTGNHVASDLPDAIEAAQGRHPNIEFAMAEYLGASTLVTEVIVDRALAASLR